MNVNLGSRHFFRNYCKYNKLLKTALLKNSFDYKPASGACECSSFANITLNRGFLTADKSGASENKSLLCTPQKRWMCEEKSSSPSNKLPQLMPDMPKIMWPSVFKSIRNFILATFIIKPYFDREFNLADFVAGSKKAVEVVSHKLAEGDLKSLEGLVTNDIIPTIQRTVSLMSLSQREQLSIEKGDIYFSFPYQVGVIFNEEEGKEQKRFVEIMMVYHSLRGLASMRSRGEEPPLNMGMLPEYQQRIFICNYRFVREFTKGVEGDWTVNLLNHFKPIDDQSDN
ncbi:hypothetical protein NQ315_009847 [Exocentrus adspersus]|uniref:Uncharacterized protein n=1 Tax=Exocentrus adspersus TaxID=1586481 RepID=A0AAV8WIM8_9CUCU|nr:hypothetical protein NQ315_009847 [Exocentrus adspersus]